MRSIVSLFLMLTTRSLFPVSQSLTWFILGKFSRRGKLQTFSEFPPVTTQKAICYAKFWKAICSLCPLVGLLIGSQGGLASETCLNIIFQFYRFNNVNAIHSCSNYYWLTKVFTSKNKTWMDFATARFETVCGGAAVTILFIFLPHARLIFGFYISQTARNPYL